MWFIGGLGNPDSVHKLTRHNLGFDVADSLVNYYKFKVLKKDSKKEVYQGYIDKEKCFICKPLNYINLSGPVVSEIIKFYNDCTKQQIKCENENKLLAFKKYNKYVFVYSDNYNLEKNKGKYFYKKKK